MYLSKMIKSVELKQCVDKLQTLLPRSFYMLQHLKLLCEFGFGDFDIYTVKRSKDFEDRSVVISISGDDPTPTSSIFYEEDAVDLAVEAFGHILDWSKPNLLHSLPDYQRPLLDSLLAAKRNEIVYDNKCYFMALKDVANIQDSKIDKTDIVRRIDPDLAGIIDSNWKFKSHGSEEMIRRGLETGGGFGVFVDGRMVSWTIVSIYGDIAHLHTLPEFRGRGYASMAISRTCQHMLSLGVTPFADVEVDNDIAIKMFKRLGFQFQWPSSWLLCQPSPKPPL